MERTHPWAERGRSAARELPFAAHARLVRHVVVLEECFFCLCGQDVVHAEPFPPCPGVGDLEAVRSEDRVVEGDEGRAVSGGESGPDRGMASSSVVVST